jgi:peroxiredoxin
MSFRKLFANVFAILAVGISCYAQEVPKNPIAIYNEASKLYFARNYVEARKLFDVLIVAFPSDTGLFYYYLNSVEMTEGKEARKTATLRCLPFYEAVSDAKRTEQFYFEYISALQTVGRISEADGVRKIVSEKFPNNPNGILGKIGEIVKNPDAIKASQMLLALYDEKNKSSFVSRQITEDHFRLVIANLELFSRDKIILAAERLEKQHFDPTMPDSLKQSQLGYLLTLIRINDGLRPKYPHESMAYLKKAKDFYAENVVRNTSLKTHENTIQNADLKTLISLQNWNEAQKIAVILIAFIDTNSTDDLSGYEATLRSNYARALEGLKQINQAREQLVLASSFDSKFKPEYAKFSLKYPLSTAAKTAFDTKMQTVIESSIKTLEGRAKAKIAKDIISRPAKDFKFTDFTGKTVSLNDYKGKILIVNFWATWCMPCRVELEDMKVAYAKYQNNPNVAFAMVSTDEERELVQPFVKKNAYNFPIFFAGDTTDKDFELNAIPRLLIIDGNGKIRFDKTGYGKDLLYLKKLDWMIESASK